MTATRIIPATEQEISVILEMIRALAQYEGLSHEVTATEERLRKTLFGPKPAAEVVLAYQGLECAGYALFFPTYSTFLAQPGIYLEDLYVQPELRGRGIGVALLRHVAKLATERDCARVEWGVLNWNQPSIEFYERLGAAPLNDWTKYRLTGEALEGLAVRNNNGGL
jgi:GNAT superfamily N-acetyltransferase